MRKMIKEFLTSNTGQLSCKRLGGCFCLFNAALMGYCSLNEAANSFLLAGVSLIGGGSAVELFAPKKEVKNDPQL